MLSRFATLSLALTLWAFGASAEDALQPSPREIMLGALEEQAPASVDVVQHVPAQLPTTADEETPAPPARTVPAKQRAVPQWARSNAASSAQESARVIRENATRSARAQAASVASAAASARAVDAAAATIRTEAARSGTLPSSPGPVDKPTPPTPPRP